MTAITAYPFNIDRAFKWLFFGILGVFLTILLLALMAKLVAFDGVPEDPDVINVRPIEIFDEPPVIEEKFIKVEPPVEVAPPPKAIVPTEPTFSQHSHIDIPTINPPVNVTADKFGVNFDSGAPVKRVSASPIYPRRALSRGIEGFVDVEYFVSPAGFSESAKIIRSEPEGYFETSAMQAVERWKFQPKEESGAETFGPIVERIRFTIDK